jgi:cytochrome b561
MFVTEHMAYFMRVCVSEHTSGHWHVLIRFHIKRPENKMKKLVRQHSWLNTTTQYGSLSIGLHWLTLLLIAAVYACILLSDGFPKGSDKQVMLKTWHFMLGLDVLVLVAIRLIVQLASPRPVMMPPIARWQNLAGKVVHTLLYLLMIAMPLLGWLILSAAGKPIPFYGLQLPSLIAENKGLVDTIKDMHEAGANAMYFLVAVHALAALYHHYFLRDNTLRRMLP